MDWIEGQRRRLLDLPRHRARVVSLRARLASRKRGQNTGQVDPQSLFQAVLLLSADVSAGVRFRGHLACIDWPFPSPSEHRLLNDDGASPPESWGTDRSAWWRLRTHLRAIEDIIRGHLDPVLIIEAETRLVPDFGIRLRSFLADVPTDWEYLPLTTPNHPSHGSAQLPSFEALRGYALRGAGRQGWYRALANALSGDRRSWSAAAPDMVCASPASLLVDEEGIA